uniref:Uncharacterized protein n=1 Tax=Quercus lobata TaxID=97700 RepID=A0A7N2LMP9_QUELO
MNRSQGISSLKRKQPDSKSPIESLTEHEQFEPSKEIIGGVWYVEGSLDTEFINFLKKHCVKIIYEQKIVTLEEILDTIRKSRAFNVEFTTQQIEEIVNALVLDDEILEVKSPGMGEINSNALVLDNERKQAPENDKIFTFKNHPIHCMIQRKEPI